MENIVHNSDDPVTNKNDPSPTSNNELLVKDDCSICKEPLRVYAKVKPCGHIFDLECIESWIETPIAGAKQCPYCRTEMKAIEKRDDNGILFTTKIPAQINFAGISGLNLDDLHQRARARRDIDHFDASVDTSVLSDFEEPREWSYQRLMERRERALERLRLDTGISQIERVFRLLRLEMELAQRERELQQLSPGWTRQRYWQQLAEQIHTVATPSVGWSTGFFGVCSVFFHMP
ncbi:hypothetical protein L207DRAFT_523645 [Hyaloscypha variabilis F]|uniref:RING-type domain-containing protein n=1 Tax=Hyaloscypha variabilis (strain UAMH 11265 / GT02V1 / F) TaxID=1149755 RepID=A0A2J6S630_HYAVF|nr:hypothetical protein L207DRAFT_523645 [Hyaloscypha variabilis F]